MALRCFLVGLVACCGFDAPTTAGVASWAESGRTWLAARASDLASLRAGATGWLAAHDPASRPAAGPSPAPDLLPGTMPAPSPAAGATIEAGSDPADEAFGAIAAATVGEFLADNAALATQEDPPAPEAEADRLALAQPTSSPADPVATVGVGNGHPPRPARAERLNSAVRLTHEAVQAWAALARAVGSGEGALR